MDRIKIGHVLPAGPVTPIAELAASVLSDAATLHVGNSDVVSGGRYLLAAFAAREIFRQTAREYINANLTDASPDVQSMIADLLECIGGNFNVISAHGPKSTARKLVSESVKAACEAYSVAKSHKPRIGVADALADSAWGPNVSKRFTFEGRELTGVVCDETSDGLVGFSARALIALKLPERYKTAAGKVAGETENSPNPVEACIAALESGSLNSTEIAALAAAVGAEGEETIRTLTAALKVANDEIDRLRAGKVKSGKSDKVTRAEAAATLTANMVTETSLNA